jgi:hypothetical protein
MTLLLYAKEMDGHQVLLGTPSQIPLRGARSIQSITIDSLVRRYGTLDLVKVDVEGAEWLVLTGSQNVTNRIHAWIVELHDRNRKKELRDWMTDYGYNHRWLDENHIFAWRESMGSLGHAP